jgi:transglutaminase-like putative cysteine protease
MALYNIRYETVNNYNSPVNEAYLNFLIIPQETEDQHCFNLNIESNHKAEAQFSETLYGAKAALFRLKGPFILFELTMTVQVEKLLWSFPTFKNISIGDERAILEDHIFKVKNKDFIIPTTLTEIDANQLPPETFIFPSETVFQYVQRINTFLQYFLSYEANVTTPTTRLPDIIQLRKGVCQDYSHLFIGIMRHNSIPVRYVSGYLNQGKQYIGAAAMHAWVEVYIPSTGWMGIDPTNNIFVNEHYIKVAHGCDYIDCTPVKGVYLSNSGGTTSYTVQITEQQSQ